LKTIDGLEQVLLYKICLLANGENGMDKLGEKVNVGRILAHLEELASYSTTKLGVTRLSFTPTMEEANRLVGKWMNEAGMIVRRDAMNNVIGRYEGVSPKAPTLLIGSHLDSVVEAGKYDGILGVIAGIEVVQTLQENGIRLNNPLEIIGFCDEEGTRFHTTLLGSRALAGTLCQEDLELCDHQGVKLAEAMREVGLDPTKCHLAARDPGSLLGYLELHIEQGPILENINQSCGIVSGIAGQSRLEFSVIGTAGHAGTVPVSMRKDALAGVSEMIQAIERIALQYDNIVATVGKLVVHPGASNVIPGKVEGTLDIRSIHDERRIQVLKEVLDKCHRINERRGLVCEFRQIMESPAVNCSPRFSSTIGAVLEEQGMKPLMIPSGAGHDAMAIASLTEIGMIFVRCKEGLSHHPDEYASPEDIHKGASVLLETVIKLTT
jgi:allantoate deiminase